MGQIYHPTHVSVSLFDPEKIPQIMEIEGELKQTFKVLNSDPSATQKALDLYDKLEKLVLSTPALARNKSMTRSEYTLVLPSVRKVIIFAFEKSEDDFISVFGNGTGSIP
jgi:hypothetical protein